ncbi:MAG TPA: hypothetical protein VLX68_02715 [Chitinivibrionales bacterium]|nr:hypothetical protein [Chitinivibrionales bacterium]
MKLQTAPLTEDQKFWISEILEFYKRNEMPDEAKILLNCHEKLSLKNLPYRNMDVRLFSNGLLNIYGIYCFDPEHDFIKQIDLILKYIKSDLLKKRKIPRIFTAEELNQAVSILDQHVNVCFRLIRDAGNFADGSMNPDGGIGCPSITIHYVSTAQNYRQYKSIDSLLKFFPEAPQVPLAHAAELTAERVGYLEKGSVSTIRLFIHKKILQPDLELLLSKNPRGPKRSDIPKISDSSARKPEEFEKCPEGYESRVEWVPEGISEKTLYRVLNLPISDALVLIDHLRLLSK